MHAQEEALALLVAELLGILNIAAEFVQQTSDAIDDAGAVGAGQGENVVGAHGGNTTALRYVFRIRLSERRLSARTKDTVIPAKAGIHLDFALGLAEQSQSQNGSLLSLG